MTRREAKEIALEVWRYLCDHPEKCKRELPEYLRQKIEGMENQCPLCELFSDQVMCRRCPLGNCDDGSPYDKWSLSYYWGEMKRRPPEEIKQEAAAEIVRRVEAWEPGEEE